MFQKIPGSHYVSSAPLQETKSPGQQQNGKKVLHSENLVGLFLPCYIMDCFVTYLGLSFIAHTLINCQGCQTLLLRSRTKLLEKKMVQSNLIIATRSACTKAPAIAIL